jgi:hypothetical protein
LATLRELAFSARASHAKAQSRKEKPQSKTPPNFRPAIANRPPLQILRTAFTSSSQYFCNPR